MAKWLQHWFGRCSQDGCLKYPSDAYARMRWAKRTVTKGLPIMALPTLSIPTQVRALATDYDGTIAHNGVVDDATWAALQRFKASGRALILVTGRRLDDLAALFPQFDQFDAVVVENGAVLHWPSTGQDE